MDRTLTGSGLEVDLDAAPPALALTCIAHPDPARIGAQRFVGSAPLVIGRGLATFGPGALDDGRLSREHCRIALRGQRAHLEDCGSRNGTTVDGAPVSACALDLGAVVTAGRLAFLVHLATPGPRSADDLGLVGISDAIVEVRRRIHAVATRTTPVLVLGETGTGKERVAQAIHRVSGRRGAFVAVNCGGLDDARISDDLFGHLPSAYTGARTARRGLVEAATDGTFFMDEIGDARPALQVALLRLLQEGTYRPLGSDGERTARCRFLAATHRPLDDASFRTDLRMRLARWVIEVPPLRERPEDIAVLAHHLAARHAGRPVPLHPRLALRLQQAPWTGNVRELDAVMERAVIEGAGDAALDDRPGLVPAGTPTPPMPAITPTGRGGRPAPEDLARLLGAADGRVAEVARQLGVGRNTLYRWLDAADLDPGAFRAP